MTESFYTMKIDEHFTHSTNYGVSVGIAGIAGVMPKKLLTEEEIFSTIKDFDEKRAKRPYSEIRKNKLGTGLLYETTLENPIEECMADAAKYALENSGYSMKDITEIHISTISPTDRLTGVRAGVLERLGYETFPVMEMRHVCAASIYVLESAKRAAILKKKPVLVIVGDDVRKDIIDKEHWDQAGLFSAGASSAVLVPGCESGYGLGDAHFWTNVKWHEIAHMNSEKDKFYMNSKVLGENGVPMYKLLLEQVIKKHDLDKNSLFVTAHQINGRILDILCAESDIRPEQVINIVGKIGNTSSPSELLALDYALKKRVKKGNDVVMFALGAGFDVAYMYLRADRTLIQPHSVNILMLNHKKDNLEIERKTLDRVLRENSRVNKFVSFNIHTTHDVNEALRMAGAVNPDFIDINLDGTASPEEIAEIIHRNIGSVPTLVHTHDSNDPNKNKVSRNSIMKMDHDVIKHSDTVVDFLYIHNIL